MQGGFENPPVGRQGVIQRPQFKSDLYVPGVSGWAIFRNGNVEFNSGTFRGTVTAGTFQGTDFVINSNGAFFYSGPPATGNLIISIASVAGTDAHANAYPAGVQVSGGGSNLMTLDPAAPAFALNPDTTKYVADWGRLYGIDNGAHGSLVLESPINSSGSPGLARLTVAGQDSGGGRGAFIQFETTGTPSGLAQFSIPAVKTNETWQAPAYSANWAGSTTFNGVGGPTLQFRTTVEDELWVYGLFTATGAAANPVFVLPAAWRPAAAGWAFCQRDNAGTTSVGSIFVSNSGNVDLFAGQGMGIVNGNQYFVNGRVPLGNIS